MQTKGADSTRLWLAAGLTAAAVIATPLLGAFEPVGPGDRAALVYPVGWSADRVFAAASGAAPVVRYGAFDNIAIVRIEEAGQVAQLRASGAVLVINADGAAACLSGPPRTV